GESGLRVAVALEDGLTEEVPAGMNLADGVAERAAGGLLENKTGCPGFDGIFDVGVVAVGGEDEHAALRSRRQQLPTRFQSVEKGHGDIHDDDVWPQLG